MVGCKIDCSLWPMNASAVMMSCEAFPVGPQSGTFWGRGRVKRRSVVVAVSADEGCVTVVF